MTPIKFKLFDMKSRVRWLFFHADGEQSCLALLLITSNATLLKQLITRNIEKRQKCRFKELHRDAGL